MSKELHPVIRSMLRTLPAGPLLDDAVRSFHLSPGDFTGELSPACAEALLAAPGLSGAKLVASTTRDMAHIEAVLAGPNPSVVRALASNPQLTDAQVDSLFVRAVERNDGALAMALLRARADVALRAPSGFFDLFSVRKGHDAAHTLGATMLRMSPKECQAVFAASGDSDKLRELLPDAVAIAIDLVRQGSAISVDTLATLLSKRTPRYGSSHLRRTRGLDARLETASKKTRAVFDEALGGRLHQVARAMYASQRPKTPEHACHAATMRLLASALEMEQPVEHDWASWSAPVTSFMKRSRADQLAAVCAHPKIVEEVFVHVPDARRMLVKQHADQLPPSVLDFAMRFPDTAVLVRAAALRGSLAPSNAMAAVVELVLDIEPEDERSLATLAEFFFSCPSSLECAREVIDRLPSARRQAAVAEFSNSRAKREATAYLEQMLVTDQFIADEDLPLIEHVAAESIDIANWSQPAIDWVAQRLQACTLDVAKLHQLNDLLPKWRLSIGKLARVASTW